MQSSVEQMQVLADIPRPGVLTGDRNHGATTDAGTRTHAWGASVRLGGPLRAAPLVSLMPVPRDSDSLLFSSVANSQPHLGLQRLWEHLPSPLRSCPVFGGHEAGQRRGTHAPTLPPASGSTGWGRTGEQL